MFSDKPGKQIQFLSEFISKRVDLSFFYLNFFWNGIWNRVLLFGKNTPTIFDVFTVLIIFCCISVVVGLEPNISPHIILCFIALLLNGFWLFMDGGFMLLLAWELE